jgi:hypothetical protein
MSDLSPLSGPNQTSRRHRRMTESDPERSWEAFTRLAFGWPLAARAQQAERTRRIGVLINLTADDPEGRARLAAFLEGLSELGWTDARLGDL